MVNVKELREKLEKELEELERVEGETRDEAKIKGLKDVIALPDEDLMAFFEKTSSKEMTDEDLDNVAGGRCSSETWKCPDCGRIICWSRSFYVVIEDHLREHRRLRELYGDNYDKIFHPNK
ncbi:MAG: hypothetical protein IKG42_07225 [Clostridia bacterium]|nr:hypothetical protein [Clostridia bacterium]